MGEAKRKKLQGIVEELSRGLTDEGKVIEAGWLAFRAMMLAPDVPEAEVGLVRAAFFSGAQHLFGTIMSIMDPGEEPTERDMRRLDRIHAELEAFIAELRAEAAPTAGNA